MIGVIQSEDVAPPTPGLRMEGRRQLFLWEIELFSFFFPELLFIYFPELSLQQ